jgi:hypothetical protein
VASGSYFVRRVPLNEEGSTLTAKTIPRLWGIGYPQIEISFAVEAVDSGKGEGKPKAL